MRNTSREEKKAEAIKRMKAFGLYPATIRQFKLKNLVSESAPPFGACYWLDEEQLERVQEFEKKHNALVYHVIHSFTNFGEMESYMYVSDSPEEWGMDMDCVKNKCPIVYVYNKTDPELSEFGSIGVRLSPAAGLERIW